MYQHNNTKIDAAWFALDLGRYRDRYELKPLSIHDHVLNFQVDKWPHLLMVADPVLERGPATVGLIQNDFEMLSSAVKEMDNGWFGSSKIDILVNGRSLSVNWCSEVGVSFAPVRLSGLNRSELKSSARAYRDMLKKAAEPSASAVLLGLPGGDQYFRHKISANYPRLVDSLIAAKEQDFIASCRTITGMGRGFSPTGDDLIHGALIAFNYFSYNHLFTEKIFPGLAGNAELTGIMGRHMLETGRRGLTSEAVQALVMSIAANKPDPPTISRILKIGSNTGYDIAAALLYYIFRMSD